MLVDRLRILARTFVWNRRTLIAIAIVLPSVLTPIGTLILSKALGDEIAVLTRQRAFITQSMRDLDELTRDFERYELDRVAFTSAMAAQGAEQPGTLALDRLFREKAVRAVRGMAAILFLTDWQERMRPYEALLREPHTPAIVVQLQAAENDLIAAAKSRLTALQGFANTTDVALESLNGWRAFWLTIGTFLMQLLTILLFFVRENREALKPPDRAVT